MRVLTAALAVGGFLATTAICAPTFSYDGYSNLERCEQIKQQWIDDNCNETVKRCLAIYKEELHRTGCHLDIPVPLNSSGEDIVKTEKDAPTGFTLQNSVLSSLTPPLTCEKIKLHCAKECTTDCRGSKVTGTICRPMDMMEVKECTVHCVNAIDTAMAGYVDLSCFEEPEDKNKGRKPSVEAKEEDQPKQITSESHINHTHTNPYDEVQKRAEAMSPPRNHTTRSACPHSKCCRDSQLICNRRCFGHQRVEVFLSAKHKACLAQCQKDYDSCTRMHHVAPRSSPEGEDIYAYTPSKTTEQFHDKHSEIEKRSQVSLLDSSATVLSVQEYPLGSGLRSRVEKRWARKKPAENKEVENKQEDEKKKEDDKQEEDKDEDKEEEEKKSGSLLSMDTYLKHLPSWLKELPERLRWRPDWWPIPPRSHFWDVIIGSPWCGQKRTNCEELCKGSEEEKKPCMERCWTRYVDCYRHNRDGPDPPM